MTQDELNDFINRIEASPEVNKAYSELNWKDFLRNNADNIVYTSWRDGVSINSLSFKAKSSIATSFGLRSADSFAKHTENTDSRICTLHSSSLLPLLLLYQINPNNKLYVRIKDKLIAFDDVRFEVPNKVFHSSFPSKIDIALISHSQQAVLYLESKFTEYLTGLASDKIADSYADSFNELGIKLNNQKIEGDLDEYPIIYGDGIKQFVAHFIGVCKGGTPRNEVEIYIKKGYKTYLGEIVYEFNSDRYDSYKKLYSNIASRLIKRLASSEKTGKGTIVEITSFNEIIKHARDFEVLPQLQTYQELLSMEENKEFKTNIEYEIKQFYRLD